MSKLHSNQDVMRFSIMDIIMKHVDEQIYHLGDKESELGLVGKQWLAEYKEFKRQLTERRNRNAE